MTVVLKKASPAAIKYACLHFHYAKRIPASRYAFNVYENDEWCGVIIFGLGATPNIAKPFGLSQGEVLELVRVALNGKQNTTSSCVAASLKQLHLVAPQVKLVVSYADEDQNHKGTIYQATNWIYLGLQNKGTPSAFIINGKQVHPRSIGSMGGVQSIEWVRKNLDKNATVFYTKGKEKYIFVFDKWERKKWLKKALPYPKKGDTDGKATEGNKQNRV